MDSILSDIGTPASSLLRRVSERHRADGLERRRSVRGRRLLRRALLRRRAPPGRLFRYRLLHLGLPSGPPSSLAFHPADFTTALERWSSATSVRMPSYRSLATRETIIENDVIGLPRGGLAQVGERRDG